MKICILSQLKTGSTSIYYMLQNKGYDIDKHHYDYDKIRNVHYDIIIIPTRPIKDIIISGYFETIDRDKFVLNISNDVNILKQFPVEKHIQNIISYDWNKNNHYTIKGIERTLAILYNIKLNEIKFKNYKIIEKTHLITGKKTKIAICDFINMSLVRKKMMFKELCLTDLTTTDIKFRTNISNEKWYGKTYKKVKDMLEDYKFKDIYDINFKSFYP